MEDLKYPIGKHVPRLSLTEKDREELIQHIADLPVKLRTAVSGLTDHQLGLHYRPGGWTIRQVVHHIPDSHMNAYVRCKLALTEEKPTIKPYDEKQWAELSDSTSAMIESSLRLVEGLHSRWTELFRSMKPVDFSRTMNHPERGIITIDDLLQLYAWHSRHHVAHITSFRERNHI